MTLDRHRRDVRRRRRRAGGRRSDRGPARRGVPGQQGAAQQRQPRRHHRRLRAQPEAARHRPHRPLPAALARRHPLAETVAAFEALHARRQDRRWGVCNFDVDDMEELLRRPGRQALRHQPGALQPRRRGIEFDLLPWSPAHSMPVMAYSPLGNDGRMLRHPELQRIATSHGASPAQIALAWVLSRPGVIAIPKATGTRPCRRQSRRAATSR